VKGNILNYQLLLEGAKVFSFTFSSELSSVL
jgi:hypothetical protein